MNYEKNRKQDRLPTMATTAAPMIYGARIRVFADHHAASQIPTVATPYGGTVRL